MSDAARDMETNVVPLFQTFESLQRNEEEIFRDYNEEWEQAYKAFDLTAASLPTEVAPAYQTFKDDRLLKAQIGVNAAKVQALVTLVASLKSAVAKRDERLFGLGSVAKRSARFAHAYRRPYHGPAATVIQLGSKQ